jgi:Mg-chelatase subunit ChlD
LLGLLALPLLPRGRGRPWRAAALAALLLALADPVAPRPAARTAVVVDVSDSARPAALEAARAAQAAGLPEDAELWLAAGEPAEVASVPTDVDPLLRPDRSDLSRALSAVAARGVGRVLLISDGRDTRGALDAARPPVPVDVLPVPTRVNARLADLDLPVDAAPGATVRVEARLTSDRSGPARIELRVGDDVVASRRVRLESASRSVAFRVDLPQRGPVRVEASLAVDWDQPTADDALAATLELAARDPVWVVGDPATARLLREQGVDVRELAPEELELPITAGAVVLRAASNRFTTGQLQALADWVDDGGGLLMTGGPQSFGLGGWYRTPVEAVLPVDGDLRSDVRVPLVAMVMVLDRSQSMAGGSPSKIGLARQGAAEVVELAFERDLLGLIAFSDESEWAFELRPATARGKLEMLAAIRGLATGGGTLLGPALEAALDALRDSDAAIKHAIVLSDGRLYDGSGPFAGPPVDLVGEAEAARQDGISISTIAVGAEADFARLRALAEAGGGRYYEALDVATLPRIFAGEALTATRSLVREEPGAPAARAHPLLAGLEPPPAPDAYVATTLKSDAEALWSYGPEETLLSVRRQGLGRTAAFTTDLSAWAGDLGGWTPLPGLLADVVRWLAARPDRFAAALRDAGPGGGAELRVDAVDDGRFLDGLALSVRTGGEEVPLRSIGPGRYGARLPPSAAGEPVVVTDGREVVARARFLAQDPEFADVDGRASLRALAETSGGRVLEAGSPWDPGPAPRPRSLAGWVAAAAALLLLAELVARRLRRG